MSAPKFKTKIIGGHGLYTDDNGMTHLREVLMETHNEIVIGGTLFALEKMFGVRSSLTIDYLNNILGIATGGTDVESQYLSNNFVCLFGVGIGGSGDSIGSKKDVKFVERELGNMVPFRHTSETLSGTDANRYWFKKTNPDSKVSYYLKTFETAPVIKALWDDGTGDEDGTEVTSNVWQSARTEDIEVFVELILKVDKTDIVEWFEANGNIEQCRVNSIGLFTGVQANVGSGVTDYKLVKMISKFNFNNEMLDMSKDLEFIYRIYTA
ncbi:MAG: hypothetical protein PHF63_00975 [Herbinix sp.]|nr:hypothetical protein [Herbinix sp.]